MSENIVLTKEKIKRYDSLVSGSNLYQHSMILTDTYTSNRIKLNVISTRATQYTDSEFQNYSIQNSVISWVHINDSYYGLIGFYQYDIVYLNSRGQLTNLCNGDCGGIAVNSDNITEL